MSAPFKLPLTIYQGSTFMEQVTWKAGQPAAPVDLTGCTARAQVRAEIEAPDVLLDLTTENGRIELGGATGTVTIKITAEDTAAITWTEGVYDLEVVFADGYVRRLLAGGVAVSPEVTRV